VLPLPWNTFYKSSWQTFLTALIARYGSNPAFVSIAVAGPTASSDEMIVSDNSNSNNPQTQFGSPIAPNEMWKKLFAFHYPGMAAYQSSDQAFIDEWDNAIDMYGEIFSGVTLVGSMTASRHDSWTGLQILSPHFFLLLSRSRQHLQPCSSIERKRRSRVKSRHSRVLRCGGQNVSFQAYRR
jgi:hypothetical protein